MKDLHKHGFEITSTGGGCTTWRKEFVDGTYILITNEKDANHELTGENACIGMYDIEGNFLMYGIIKIEDIK